MTSIQLFAEIASRIRAGGEAIEGEDDGEGDGEEEEVEEEEDEKEDEKEEEDEKKDCKDDEEAQGLYTLPSCARGKL